MMPPVTGKFKHRVLKEDSKFTILYTFTNLVMFYENQKMEVNPRITKNMPITHFTKNKPQKKFLTARAPEITVK